METALTLENVGKRYADHTAVGGLSLSVPRGTIYGILGPNGAGKSTTLRMIMNIIARDSGRISLLGVDPARDREVLKRVGYLPEDRGLYRKMKVLDTLVFFARLKGVSKSDARERGVEWLERLGLTEWQDARVETLSKGMQQKVQFITTVLHQPELLVLDEPFSGLDPVNQDVLEGTIVRARDEGNTVLFSTHIMEQAERICDHVCIIANGEKVLEGGIREVRRREAGERYEIEFEHPTDEVGAFREGGPWVSGVEQKNGAWRVDLAPGADRRALLTELNGLDGGLLRFLRVEPTLHEIFVSRVGNAGTARRRREVARG